MFKREEIRDYAIDGLKGLVGYYTKDITELHNDLFNMDYYIIGTYLAEQWLGSHVFEVIGIIQEYENDMFGEVTTDLTSPESIVNMYAYIVGEEVLNDSSTYQNSWDKKADDDILNDIINEL